MASVEDLRALALALPAAEERDHHGRPSFQVGGRVFATLWDLEHANLMLDEGGIRSAVEALPDACALRWWGKRLAAVEVELAKVDPAVLGGLLAEAWENKSQAKP
jgi:hypothetical protein